MSIERIGLVLFVVAAGAWATVVALSLVAILPWGLVGIAVLAVVAYMLLRAMVDHTSSAEDVHYERDIEK